MKNLFSMFVASIVATLVLCSCEYHEYCDVHGIEDDGRVYCYSNGEKHYDLTSDFVFYTDNLYYIDSITMDDGVQTANDKFSIKCDELLDVSQIGNYEVRKYRFKAAFIVYITSFAHETYWRYLPFEFEAKELWLNNNVVARQPFVFEMVDWEVTELPLTADDESKNMNSKYLIRYLINAYNGYNRQKITDFEYLYEVTRSNESVWTSSTEYEITVTYDWKP